MSNPWNLCAHEIAVLEALIESGTDKRAARALDISHRTVEWRVREVRQKMDGVCRLTAVIKYDRWARESKATCTTCTTT